MTSSPASGLVGSSGVAAGVATVSIGVTRTRGRRRVTRRHDSRLKDIRRRFLSPPTDEDGVDTGVAQTRGQRPATARGGGSSWVEPGRWRRGRLSAGLYDCVENSRFNCDRKSWSSRARRNEHPGGVISWSELAPGKRMVIFVTVVKTQRHRERRARRDIVKGFDTDGQGFQTGPRPRNICCATRCSRSASSASSTSHTDDRRAR